MRIAIVGAGSLGSVFGGVLASGGSEVFLLSRSQPYIDQVTQSGLILLEDSGLRTTYPKVTSDASSVGPVDLVIVLVKSFDTRDAMENASALVGPSTTVLSLQNGLGNEEILAELFGTARLLYGRTFVGGDAISLGKVTAGLAGKLTIIGEPDGRASSRAGDVAHVFNSAGLLTQISENISGVIWNKLLVNVATGALAGVTRLTYGYLYELPVLAETAIAAVNEGISVARAIGVKLISEDAEEIWHSAGRGQPLSFRTSIFQSLERKAKTEIDFINGALVRMGEKVGVATPVNRTLVACIKGLEFSASVG
ncbi:MAG: ketopantoate reductase family protein [Actinomycetota bacterium]|nr:MAG: ketopantoate reductase family protein [Actinomycetota bacterium]